MEATEELNFFNVLLPLAAGIFIIAMGVVLLNRHFHRNLYRQQLKQKELKSLHQVELLESSIQVQEEERKRIATDLHDRLGSMLSTVKLLHGALDESIDKKDPEARMKFDKAGNLLDEAVLEVRRIAHDLSTGLLITYGLVPALEELCSGIDKSKKIKCRLLCYGMQTRLGQQKEIGVYRMIQELVNNALKHSGAGELTIQLNHTLDSVNITVEDNGIGFNVAEKMKSGGLGLRNLQARAAKLGVNYHTDSMPGHGTISIIEIPLSNDTHSDS